MAITTSISINVNPRRLPADKPTPRKFCARAEKCLPQIEVAIVIPPYEMSEQKRKLRTQVTRVKQRVIFGVRRLDAALSGNGTSAAP
jgi:hypothetical protein